MRQFKMTVLALRLLCIAIKKGIKEKKARY